MAERINKAILRTGKIKSWKHLAKVGKHNYRLIPTSTVPGAMPPTDLVPGPTDLTQRVRAKHKELGVKHEKGKILAIEVLMTASPEWWAAADNWQKKEFFEQSVKSLRKKFGEGVVSINVHIDESTPHIQAVVVPVYQDIKSKPGPKPTTPEGIAKRAREEAAAPKVWRISYDRILGGHREVLARYQTEYHSYVKHLGLSRGEDTVGQGIKHTTLKDYAKRLEAEKERLAALNKEIFDAREDLETDKLFFEAESQRLINDLQIYRNNKAQADARKKRLDKQERELRKREQGLEAREQSLHQREMAATQRLDKAEATERSAIERQTDVGVKLEGLARREAALVSSQKRLDEQVGWLTEDQDAVQKRERAAFIHETQIAIVSDMASGKSSAQWGRTDDRPTLAQEPDEKTKAAVDAPWSAQLKLAGIAFTAMIARRSRLMAIIDRVRKALAANRKRKTELEQREHAVQVKETAADRLNRSANDRIQAADLKTLKADELIAKNTKLSAALVAERREMDERRQFEEDEIRSLGGQADQARADRDLAVLEGKTASAKTAIEKAGLGEVTKKRAHGEAEVETLKANKVALLDECSGLADAIAQLKEDRAVLIANIEPMIAQRQELDASKAQLAEDQRQYVAERAVFKADEEKNAHAQNLIVGVLSNQHSIEAGREDFVLTPHDSSQRSRLIGDSEVPDWFRPLVQTIEQAEDAERTFQKARSAVLKRYPVKDEEIEAKIPSPTPVRSILNQGPSFGPNFGP